MLPVPIRTVPYLHATRVCVWHALGSEGGEGLVAEGPIFFVQGTALAESPTIAGKTSKRLEEYPRPVM